MSLEYTPVKPTILCLIFSMYVATIQRLDYSGPESKNHNLQFLIALRQGQGHWTWYELVDLQQGNKHANLKDLNSVCEKNDVKVSVKSGNTSLIYLEYVRK